MTLVFVFAFALSLAPAAASAPSDQTLADIDAYVTAEMTAGRVPGLALGIVQDDQVIFLKGYGKAGHGREMTPQTPMALGSTSKSLTALAVMQLAEANRLDLDAPVRTYLPDFRTADAEASGRITVRQLLNQTSGLSRWDGRLPLVGDGTRTLGELVEGLKESALNNPPGVAFEYSNLNYSVLGLVVEKVSGQSFGAYLKAHIFGPLEMTSAGASPTEVKDPATGHRMWYGFAGATDLPHLADSVPAGYIIASAEDMSHHLIAQMNGGAYGGRSVLSPAGVTAMQTGVAQMNEESGYGMGWIIGPVDGVPTIRHDGELANFHSEMVMLPGSKTGFVLLSNVAHLQSGLVLWRMNRGITAILAGKPAPQLTWLQRNMWPLYQLVCLAVALPLLWMPFGWRRLPRRLRRSGKWAWLRVGAGVAVNLAVGAGIWYVLPWFSGAPWSLFLRFDPDLAWLLSVVIAFNLAGAIARLYIAFRTLRKQDDTWKQSSANTTA